MASSEASSRKRLHTCIPTYVKMAILAVDEERDLGDCVEDEINVKILEDVEK